MLIFFLSLAFWSWLGFLTKHVIEEDGDKWENMRIAVEEIFVEHDDEKGVFARGSGKKEPRKRVAFRLCSEIILKTMGIALLLILNMVT